MPAGCVTFKASDSDVEGEAEDEVYNIIMTPPPAEQRCAAWSIKKVPAGSKVPINVVVQPVAECFPQEVLEWFKSAVFDVEVVWSRPTLVVEGNVQAGLGQTLLVRQFAAHEVEAKGLAEDKKGQKVAEKDAVEKAAENAAKKRRLEQCDSAPDADYDEPVCKVQKMVEKSVML